MAHGVTAYLERNTFAHLHARHGVTAADEQRLRDAIAEHRLTIFLSPATIEETLALAEEAPALAKAQLDLILDLSDRTRLVKPPGIMLADDIKAYADGAPTPEPFVSVDADMWADNMTLPIEAAAQHPDILAIVKVAREQKEEFRDGLEPARVARTQHARKFRRLTFEALFQAERVPFAEALATRVSVLDQVRARGLDGLLHMRSVRATVGFSVALVYAQLVNGRVPRESDSRDMHHAVMAAAADVFVTDDGRLRDDLRRVPDLPFEVITLPELVTRVAPAGGEAG